jgi:hypothetical protein
MVTGSDKKGIEFFGLIKGKRHKPSLEQNIKTAQIR